MTELEIFAAALQLADPPQRAAYLDRVCGADAALRQRIELLFRNLTDAGSFLATPAGAPTSPTPEREAGDDPAAIALDFLQPSGKPGALGRLGHYEVLEVLGQGGFGVVVRAFDEKLHRMVAIKVMSSRLAATSPARKRFIREARSSAAIRHENVVAIHAIEEQPVPFLVMEFIAGETLQQRVDRTGPLDPADVLRIGVQIAHGLAAAHAMGRSHRDIKPANILLENGVDRVKITDFGLARAADDASLTQSGVIAGTPLYMAPEQAQGVVIDHRADLFSLGSVLYAICSGRPPFRAATALAVLKRVADDPPRPIREIIPEVPEGLCAVIAKLHAKKPERRFQTANEVAEALANLLRETPDDHVAGPPRRRRRTLRIAVAALCTLTLLGLGVAAIQRTASFDKKLDEQRRPNAALVAEAESDRRAAEYVLSRGGWMTIRKDGIDRDVYSRVGLPDGHFELSSVALGQCPNVNDADLAVFSSCQRLQSIELALTGISNAGLVHLRGCKALVNIDIGGTQVTNVGLAELKAHTGLAVLFLGGLTITDDGLAQLANLRGVAQLYLGDSPVSDAGLAHFKDNKNLQRIVLTRTRVTSAGLANFKNCTDLFQLDVGADNVTDDGLAHFARCKNLAFLALWGTGLTDVGMAHFGNWKRLELVDLGRVRIGDAGLSHLAECKELNDLYLADTLVSDAGLALLSGCPRLCALNVRRTNVTEAGVKKLAAELPACRIEWDGGAIDPTANPDPDRRVVEWLRSPHWPVISVAVDGTEVSLSGHFEIPKKPFQLRRLTVYRHPKVADNVSTMLQGLRHLTHLNIRDCKVSDAVLNCFQDCTDLRELQLHGTGVTDAGLARIAKFVRLRYVNLNQTAVTAAAVNNLAAALPHCTIEWSGGVIDRR